MITDSAVIVLIITLVKQTLVLPGLVMPLSLLDLILFLVFKLTPLSVIFQLYHGEQL